MTWLLGVRKNLYSLIDVKTIAFNGHKNRYRYLSMEMICSEMQTGFHKEGVISDTNQDSVINLLPFHPPLKGQSCRAFDFFKVVNIYYKIYCIFKFLYHFGGLSALSLVEERACCMTNQTTAAKEATSNSLRTLVCIFMHLINIFLSLFSSWRRLSHHMVFLWKSVFSHYYF